VVSEKPNRITVLHLIGTLGIGGMEQQLVSLAPRFDSERFRIIVCTVRPKHALAKVLAGSHVEVTTINFRMRYLFFGLWRLHRLVKQEKVDILHMHNPALPARIFGMCVRGPIVVTTDHGQGYWKKPWHYALERYAIKRTALRIAVSKDVAEILKAREFVPEEKLLIMPNAVEAERFRLGETERANTRAELGLTEEMTAIATIARLVKEKALHVLIAAFAELAGRVPQARLLVVGDGPLKADLESYSVDLGIADRVLFTGARLDIPNVLAAVDIFALSSQNEGLPVSLLEAMAAAKPIVATKVGGIPEAVTNREEGLLVAPDDPKALADALYEVISQPDLASRLGRQAAEKVATNYSAAAAARNLEEVYCSLLDRKRLFQNRGTEGEFV